jgi:putative chitinase
MPAAKARADQYVGPLNAAMSEYYINTPTRQAAFLAQIAH